jgi:hypothetical protein
MGREVIAGDGNRRLRSELQARNPLGPNGGGDIGGIAPGRGDDGPANRKSRGQLPENSRRKPFGNPLSDASATFHNGQLDPGITDIDYEIHNSRKVL